MRKVALVLSVVMLAFAGRLSAHAGHEHQALGTVIVADASHIEIKTKDGKTVSVQLDAETKYMNGKIAAVVADVKVGQRVAVTYVEKNEKDVAKEVLLGVTETPADPKPHEHH